MYDLKGYAVRKNGVINVTLSGLLANSCYTSKIVDKYPGGNIQYVQAPGSAQVFIEETIRPNSGFCTMALVPWVEHVNIVDSKHKNVTVFINDEIALKLVVKTAPKKFIVIALTTSGSDGHKGCSVVASDAVYPAIYSKVYGPASKEKCDKWLIENCTITTFGGEWPFPMMGAMGSFNSGWSGNG